MAIKDQCTQCTNIQGGVCKITNNPPLFNQTSCSDYVKASINLDKADRSNSSSITGGSSIGSNPVTPSSSAQQSSVNNVENQPQRMFQHPFSFNGRIRRLEYGISVIIYSIWAIVANVAADDPNISGGAAILILVTCIPAFWFYLAQICKRFHDRGKSGWHYFTLMIPLYNLYVGVMQLFDDGDPHENEYGPDPKGRNMYS